MAEPRTVRENANALNSEQIAALLPHRYPFALVDRILDYEPGQWAIGRKCVTRNEEFFNGHFPAQPVMPGVLLLEDLDLWASPLLDAEDDSAFLLPSLSRAAREAINLIRSAVDNPEVYVLASSSDATEIDSFFYDLLEPLTLIDIDYPDDAERREIWLELLRDHPSFKGLNVYDLVKFTAGMPRYDIYMAAREAVPDCTVSVFACIVYSIVY